MKRAPAMMIDGVRAARRISSRLQGSRDQRAFWRPLTLHWRRTPRLRTRRDGGVVSGSWTSIFAPHIVLHLHSNLIAGSKSATCETTRSMVEWQIHRDAVLYHREASQARFSRERTFSRMRERYNAPASRANFFLVSRFQPRAEALSQTASLSLIHHAPCLAVTKHFATQTTYLLTRAANYARHSTSLSVTVLGPTTDALNRGGPINVHFAESPHAAFLTELVWRQPQAAARVEGREIPKDFSHVPRGSRAPASDSVCASDPDAKSGDHRSATSLDGAQMDRLVDNVIQRVEKRVRIERDRRGW
jgi:hypothetical protein